MGPYYFSLILNGPFYELGSVLSRYGSILDLELYLEPETAKISLCLVILILKDTRQQ